ncbi:MAG: hypothetical protein HGB03_03395 [Candidatus Yonathbacteria bacterium]|nr:hypothetical protein [Candidatus Yonathbacteria bacterium]NTW47327.1 hypothetical protein [Candidatus Yonathbacteria bacterium]
MYTENDFRTYIKNFSCEKEEVEGCMKLLNNVVSIINDDISIVLRGVDFNPKDKKKEKLESILSEMRTVCFLNNKGFQEIKFISAKKNQKEVDISAKIKEKEFFIEVKCLTEEYSRPKEHYVDAYLFDDKKFFRTLDTLVCKNLEQLLQYEKEKRIFTFVFNRAPELQCCNKEYYMLSVKKLYEKYKEDVVHFMFITGYREEDFIYPIIS